MNQNYKVLEQSFWEASDFTYDDPRTAQKHQFSVRGCLSCEYDSTVYNDTNGPVQNQIFPKITNYFKEFISLQSIKQRHEYGRSFEKFQEYLKSEQFSKIMSQQISQYTKEQGLRNWNIVITEIGVAVQQIVTETKVIDTNSNKKDGQDKCPKCGATEISLNQNTGNLRCHFCRFEFPPVQLNELDSDISQLQGTVITSAAQDIVADTKDIMTFKCSSCGAEVVIDTTEALQARCHWCRNVLSINQQIPNGSVPDVVLPFKTKKEEARNHIETFVKKRKFFANPKFTKEFTTENIMGVYLPYMIVDINAHSSMVGQGEHLVRKYVVKNGDSTETRYDADLYDVARDFDIQIDDLTVESNAEKLDNTNANKTNNVINSIMPFDVENSVQWNSNYLKGFSSERRDTNIDELKDFVATQAKDVSRYKINETAEFYDRGIRWDTENFIVKGQRWKTAYLPIWLYSYQEKKKNGKSLLHYVAVNARTNETMGSVPINIPKLLLFSFFVEILGFIMMLLLLDETDYSVLFLVSGFVFYFIMYGKYRNKDKRHNHERDTKSILANVNRVDNFVKHQRGLSNAKIRGINSDKVSGINFSKNKKNKK